MEDPNSTLLPYILETLSRKPDLCDTLHNLCRDIELQLKHEHNDNFGNVRSSINRAINVGQSLGILTLTNDVLRVPFNFHVKGGKAPGVRVAQSQAQPPIGTGNQNMHQRTPGVFGQKSVRKSVQNQQHGDTHNGSASNGLASAITQPPHAVPTRTRPRMVRSRPTPRRRARSRSTIRRRPYARRRPIRGRSRSSYSWRRRR